MCRGSGGGGTGHRGGGGIKKTPGPDLALGGPGLSSYKGYFLISNKSIETSQMIFPSKKVVC